MVSGFDRWRNRFRGNNWLLAFNALGMGYNLALLLTIATSAFIIELAEGVPFSWYASVHWLLWAAAAMLHASIVWDYPSSTAENIFCALLGLIGGGFGGYSLGFYSGQFWGPCVFDEDALNPTELDICLDQRYIVWFTWVFALLITIGGAAIAGVCLANAFFANSLNKKKRAVLE